MPSKSRKQQRYLFSKFGEAWVRSHHFDELAKRKPKAKKSK